MNEPTTIAQRILSLDRDRALVLSATQGADGRLKVLAHLEAGQHRTLLLGVPANRLRDLAQALESLAGELGVRP